MYANRKTHHPTAFLTILAAAFIVASLYARDVFADHPVRDIEVAFDEIDARVVRGKLQVTYEIDRADWRRLRRTHIRPRLNLYTPKRRGHFTYAYSVELSSRTATVLFPHHVRPTGHARSIEVRLSGERGRVRIATTSYGSSCGSRVRVALARPAHHRKHHRRGHGHHHNEVAVIRACDAQTSWSGDLNECIAKGNQLGAGAPATINACGASTSWSGDFFDCLDLSAGIRRNPVGTIRACDDATSWSGDFEACLKSAASYHADAAPTIHACSSATSWSGDFKACMSQARPLGRSAPRVVNACDAATSWSGEFKECLVAARRG